MQNAMQKLLGSLKKLRNLRVFLKMTTDFYTYSVGQFGRKAVLEFDHSALTIISLNKDFETILWRPTTRLSSTTRHVLQWRESDMVSLCNVSIIFIFFYSCVIEKNNMATNWQDVVDFELCKIYKHFQTNFSFLNSYIHNQQKRIFIPRDELGKQNE